MSNIPLKPGYYLKEKIAWNFYKISLIRKISDPGSFVFHSMVFYVIGYIEAFPKVTIIDSKDSFQHSSHKLELFHLLYRD